MQVKSDSEKFGHDSPCCTLWNAHDCQHNHTNSVQSNEDATATNDSREDEGRPVKAASETNSWINAEQSRDEATY